MSGEKRAALNAKMETLYKTFSQISNNSLTQKIANSDIWTGGNGSAAVASQSPAKEGIEGLSAVKASKGLLSPIIPPPDNAEGVEGLPGTPKQQTGDSGGMQGAEGGLGYTPSTEAIGSDEDREKQGSVSRRVSFKKTTLLKEQV